MFLGKVRGIRSLQEQYPFPIRLRRIMENGFESLTEAPQDSVTSY